MPPLLTLSSVQFSPPVRLCRQSSVFLLEVSLVPRMLVDICLSDLCQFYLVFLDAPTLAGSVRELDTVTQAHFSCLLDRDFSAGDLIPPLEC